MFYSDLHPLSYVADYLSISASFLELCYLAMASRFYGRESIFYTPQPKHRHPYRPSIICTNPIRISTRSAKQRNDRRYERRHLNLLLSRHAHMQ